MYGHLASRLGGSPLSSKEETSLLAYFNTPPLAEFQPQIADGLSQVLGMCNLALSAEQNGTITFTGYPAGTSTANTTLDGYLGQGYAILLRKDSPKTAGTAPLQGILTSDPLVLQQQAGRTGQYAIVKPFTPYAGPPIEKVSFKTDYSGWWVAAVVTAVALTLLAALRSPKPPGGPAT